MRPSSWNGVPNFVCFSMARIWKNLSDYGLRETSSPIKKHYDAIGDIFLFYSYGQGFCLDEINSIQSLSASKGQLETLQMLQSTVHNKTPRDKLFRAFLIGEYLDHRIFPISSQSGSVLNPESTSLIALPFKLPRHISVCGFKLRLCQQ